MLTDAYPICDQDMDGYGPSRAQNNIDVNILYEIVLNRPYCTVPGSYRTTFLPNVNFQFMDGVDTKY